MNIRTLGRKVGVAAGTAVLIAGSSTLFAGTAFAHGSDDDCNCEGHSSHHHADDSDSHDSGDSEDDSSTAHDGDHHWGEDDSDYRVNGAAGRGGNGGPANANCLVPVGATAGVVGQGGNVSQCNATGGAGGAGGGGVYY